MTERVAATNDLEALDLARVFHPNTNLAALHRGRPLVLTRGKGVHVFDDHGKQYIEAMAGLWCTTLGYGDDELARTAYEQIKKLSFSHLFTGKSHEPAILLADKLVQMAPFAASRVFFGNSGSDANDTQIKLVWYYNNASGRPKKKKIIARSKGYHGTTLGSAGLTGLPSFHKLFDVPLPPFLHTDAPYYYRGAQAGESEEDYSTRLAQNLEQLIQSEGPDTVAAFIAEPLMGVGGVLLPPSGYFPKIQAVLEKYAVLLIDDEVITGFGRTGELWGAQAFGMRPQTLTAAKALSSAYLPISAVIVPEFLYAPMIEASGEVGLFGHGFTYSGHPVAAAVALRVLGIYEERKLYEHVREMAPQFQAALTALTSHPLVGDTRGIGLVGACELVQNKTTKAAFDAKLAVGAKCMHYCQEHGLIVRAIGDVIALCPPYIVTAANIDEIFAKLRRGLDDTLEWARRERVLPP
jgi:4-aminobutyrate---pyruvate transaminase